jgi:hypothetical protein
VPADTASARPRTDHRSPRRSRRGVLGRRWLRCAGCRGTCGRVLESDSATSWEWARCQAGCGVGHESRRPGGGRHASTGGAKATSCQQSQRDTPGEQPTLGRSHHCLLRTTSQRTPSGPDTRLRPKPRRQGLLGGPRCACARVRADHFDLVELASPLLAQPDPESFSDSTNSVVCRSQRAMDSGVRLKVALLALYMISTSSG